MTSKQKFQLKCCSQRGCIVPGSSGPCHRFVFLLPTIGPNDQRQTEEIGEGGRDFVDKRRGPEIEYKPFQNKNF